jgi:hypothetical protein
MSVGEQEILREARRVLRKLADGKRLVTCDAQRFAITATGSLRNAVKVERETVEAFAARDWIRGTAAKGFTLSDAGLGWLARAECEYGEPFAAQHRLTSRRIVTDPHGIEREVEINDAESPLSWLKRRKLIDTMQYEAGEKLRRDFTIAQLEPRLAVDLAAPIVSGGPKSPAEFSEIVVAARQRFSLAMKAVGPVLADLLFDVCCHLVRLEGVEQEHGWPQRSAKVVLQIALNRLGEHYGLCVTAPAHGRTRSWTAALPEMAAPQ